MHSVMRFMAGHIQAYCIIGNLAKKDKGCQWILEDFMKICCLLDIFLAICRRRNKDVTKEETSRSEGRAQILKAMAHPSRIFIIEKLSEKPYCVYELTEMIGVDVSTVSKHLSVLKNAGIISDTKKGTTVYYSLEAPCLLRFIGCVEQVIEQNIKKQLESIGSVSGE